MPWKTIATKGAGYERGCHEGGDATREHIPCQSTSRRYASHWNSFLLISCGFSEILHKRTRCVSTMPQRVTRQNKLHKMQKIGLKYLYVDPPLRRPPLIRVKTVIRSARNVYCYNTMSPASCVKPSYINFLITNSNTTNTAVWPCFRTTVYVMVVYENIYFSCISHNFLSNACSMTENVLVDEHNKPTHQSELGALPTGWCLLCYSLNWPITSKSSWLFYANSVITLSY